MLPTESLRDLLKALDAVKQASDRITCKCRLCLVRRIALLEAQDKVLKVCEQADEPHTAPKLKLVN